MKYIVKDEKGNETEVEVDEMDTLVDTQPPSQLGWGWA